MWCHGYDDSIFNVKFLKGGQINLEIKYRVSLHIVLPGSKGAKLKE